MRIVGPILAAISLFAMLAWTWNKCPDPVIDYGREVYVPWRITQGQVLYRDINYFNGPLVPYFDALLFKLFGPSIRTLKIFNAIVLFLLAALIYAMVRAMSDDWAACVAGILLPTLFTCQQIAGATFNFLTPYSYELSLGVAMSLAMVACFWRASISNRKALWIAAAGVLLGLIVLTKAEVFLAALVSAVAGMICLLWSMHPAPAQLLRSCTLVAACTLAPVALATLLLLKSLPLSDAISGLAGSWKWLGDLNLTQMYYFRWMMGTDDPSRSVLNMAAWTGVYVALLMLCGGIARAVSAKPQATKAAVALIVTICAAAPIGLFWDWIPWRGFLRPLPIAMIGILLVLVARLRRTPREDAARFVLPICFTMFSLALLAKIALYPRSNHYGFALAMPATMIFVALLVCWAPQWLDSLSQHSGRGQGRESDAIVRATMITALLAAGYAHVRINHAWIARRTNLVSGNGDSFYAAEYGQFTQQTIDFIIAGTKPADTLVCMPEGLLINFLTRRMNPTPDMNFNPPSLVMYGEENMLARLKEHAPDWIALVGCDTRVYGVRYFGRDYGRLIARWIHDEYEPAQLFGAPPFLNDQLGIMIMRHRTPKYP